MEKRNRPGRPVKPESEKRHKYACSVTAETLIKAREYYVTLGNAIDMAVKYANVIKALEADNNNSVTK